MKTVIRQFRTHTFSFVVMIVSLIVGFSVSVLLVSKVIGEAGYDKYWEGEDQLFRIGMEQYKNGELSFRSARSYLGLPGVLVEEFPEVTEMTRLIPDVVTVFAGEHQIQDVNMFYADTNIFQVLPRKILAAESPDIFPGIQTTAISASLAQKLYGTVQCLGQKLRLNEGWTFYISTVFEDIPGKSHLAFDVLLSRESLAYYMQNFDNLTGKLAVNKAFVFTEPGPYHKSSWSNLRSYNYVRIKNGTDIQQLQEKVEERVNELKLYKYEVTIVPDFQSIQSIYLHSDYPDEIKTNGSAFNCYMLLIIAGIVLFVSWINFVNLYSVVIHERMRIFAIQIIHGQRFMGIVRDLFFSVFVISLLAAFISLLVAWFVDGFYPYLVINVKVLIVLLVLIILTSVLSVLLMLFFLKHGKLIEYLKNKGSGFLQGKSFGRMMLFLQFSSGIVLISCALVAYHQISFVNARDLGFDHDDTVFSFSPMTMNQKPDVQQILLKFRNKMDAIPEVEAFCVSSTIPGQPLHFQGENIYRMKGSDRTEAYVHRINVDHSYLDLYGIKILAGRGFLKNEQYDVDEIVLNEMALKQLGFSEPANAIDRFVYVAGKKFRIVGVTKNYHHYSLKDKMLPVAFFKSLKWRAFVGYYSFKLSPVNQNTLDKVAYTWKEIYPGEQFLYRFVEDGYIKQYEAERKLANSFLMAAILAILISCLGMLAQMRINILKRTKEIGIRKTFGANSRIILQSFHSEAIIIISISALAAIPIAWMVSERWLENFAYHVKQGWWLFLLAVLILAITVLTTTYVLTQQAARKNPVEALRYE